MAWLLPSNISLERCESHITTCGVSTLLDIPKSACKFIPPLTVILITINFKNSVDFQLFLRHFWVRRADRPKATTG